MHFLDKYERKWGWLSFQGLLRYYALFHVMVFLLQFLNPNIGNELEFDRQKILEGEIWRLFTFLFASSGFREHGEMNVLFLFIMVMVAFLMSDALEAAWGVFRTTIFYYLGYLGLIVANFIYEWPMPGSGFLIYTSAFLAFATLFPKVEFMVLFVIPVQVRWLALLLVITGAVSISTKLHYLGYVALAFVNYILWAGIPALRGSLRMIEAMPRASIPGRSKARGVDAFHTCVVCGRTELSNPELEFRIAKDGEEYCNEHMPKHHDD